MESLLSFFFFSESTNPVGFDGNKKFYKKKILFWTKLKFAILKDTKQKHVHDTSQ